MGLLAATVLLSGCQGNPSPGDSESGSAKKTSAKSSKKKRASGTADSEKAVSAKDVWFEKPLQVARDTTALATPNGSPPTAVPPKASAAPMPQEGSTPPAEAAPLASGGWETLISGETIASEVKQIRLQMKELLTTVSKYNGNYKGQIPMHASVLSGLAAIAAKHPDSVPWKTDARFVRDLAADVRSKAKGLGNESHEATQKAWEQLDELLNGNKPAKLPEAAETVAFSEVVNRGAAMKRMEKAYEWLKSTINSPEALKKEQEKALQEASLLAVMTRIIGTAGYDSADDDEYKRFVQAMDLANLEALGAVKNGDFAAFTDALSRGNKTCAECHTNFKE